MRQIQVADLTASANEIDNQMGPIPGRSSDRIANELRWGAAEVERLLKAAVISEEPVAWVVYTPNGNVRLWGKDRAGPQAFADEHGLECEPVYRGPWVAGEREAVARAIFGDGWECCANLGPYVQGTVNELAEARELLGMFSPDDVDHHRDLIEQGREKPPSFTAPALPEDAKAALKSAINHIEHMAQWITSKNAGYHFEALGEDMSGIRAAYEALGGKP